MIGLLFQRKDRFGEALEVTLKYRNFLTKILKRSCCPRDSLYVRIIVQIVNSFREAKVKADKAGEGGSAISETVNCLHSLTTLRACLLSRLSSGETLKSCLPAEDFHDPL